VHKYSFFEVGFVRLSWQKSASCVLAVVFSGLCLGLSQPLVVEFLNGPEPILGKHGLLGLLSLIGYAPVIYVLRGASVGRAFVLAFFASLIHFAIVFYWIVIACTVFGHVSLALSLALLLLLAATVSCYIGSAFALAQYLHLRFGFVHYLIVPAAVCSVEYLRNYGFFGGFPWGNIGYSIAQLSVFLQGASVVGVYGLVFLVVMINALLADFARVRFNILQISKRRALLFVALIALPVLFGAWRLSDGFDTNGRILKVALLQGNVEQGIKNQGYFNNGEVARRYADMQSQAVLGGAELVVWPESAYPEDLYANTGRLSEIGTPAQITVLGAVIYDQRWLHNSAVVVDKNAAIKARYHKSHLVPFGEYVPWPFRNVASRVVPRLGAFRPGADYLPVEMKLEDGTPLSLGLTVCYEGVFPEIARKEAQYGADLLVNITNDAWYGVSSAPFQHLHMYRLRAVETGLPVVRATNTGVSAWVDALGFVNDPTRLYEKAIVLTDVPLVKKQTLYLVIGDVIAQLSLVFVLFAFLLGLVGKDVFVRRRAVLEWTLGALGIALVLWSGWHYADAKAALDESAITKQVFLSAYGFILLAGAWSDRQFGRKLLIIASCVLMVLSFLVGLAEGYEYWATGALAGLVTILAFTRTKAYK
jgi:apolipoprotein N-acyltransferase